MTFITDTKLYDRDRVRNTWTHSCVAGVRFKQMLGDHPELWPDVRSLLSMHDSLQLSQCEHLLENDLVLVFADDMAALDDKMASLLSHPAAGAYVYAFDHGAETSLHAA